MLLALNQKRLSVGACCSLFLNGQAAVPVYLAPAPAQAIREKPTATGVMLHVDENDRRCEWQQPHQQLFVFVLQI